MKRSGIAFAALCILIATSASAVGTPEQVAAEYLEAVRARGFAAQADFLLPEEAVRFRDMLIPVFEGEEAAGRRALLNATFGRGATLLTVRLAEPQEVVRRFARVMAVRMPDQPTGFDELRVLGTVVEEETVHVLARLRTLTGDAAQDRLEVVSLRPRGDHWGVLLSPNLEASLRGMRDSGERPRAEPQLVPEPPPEAPAVAPVVP